MSEFIENIKDIPLYQDLYGDLLSSQLSEKDLYKLPEITKNHIASKFPDAWMTESLQQVLKENNYEFMTTSGTSNERTKLIRPNNWWDGEEKRLYKYMKKLAPQYSDMRSKAILTTAICSNTTCYKEVPIYEKRIVNGILHLNITADPNNWKKEDIERIVYELDLFKPQCLQADPVYLSIFIKLLLKHNIKRPEWMPYLLLLTYEYCPIKCLKIINEFLDIPIYKIYGTTETGFIFIEQPNKKTVWILDSTHLFFKPIDKNGEINEILLTSFRNPYMPFINLNSKDLVLIKDSNKKHKFNHSELEINQFMGRTKDLTYSSKGKVITVGDIDNILSELNNNILIYCIDFNFDNKIIFKYTTINDEPLSNKQHSQIMKKINDLYEKYYIIEFIHAKEIHPAYSGKFEILKKQKI